MIELPNAVSQKRTSGSAGSALRYSAALSTGAAGPARNYSSSAASSGLAAFARPPPAHQLGRPYVAASNPAAAEIVILDAETLAERRRVKLEGVPFDILAVRGRGMTH